MSIVGDLKKNSIWFLLVPLGNLHQSQYCDRIKVLVEFLGTKLSLDELTTIWKMQVLHCTCSISQNNYICMEDHGSIQTGC